MRTICRTSRRALTLLFFFAAALGTNVSAQDRPLLQPGKKSLYQRVLTTPECLLHTDPQSKQGKPVPAFSRFYVYERTNAGGKDWIKVGSNSRADIAGWLEQDCTVDWKMQLTLAFTNPANRDPVIFFEDKAALEQIADAPDPAAAIAPIIKSLADTGHAAGVVAREPELAVAQNKKFYLLPIFQAQEIYTQSGAPLRILNVASVTKPQDPAEKQTSTPTQDTRSALKAFSAAVVFVIDSTISMGPYIERTREAVRAISRDVESSGLSKQVKFGLIAYRSSTKAVPGLEYVSELYVDPTTVTSGEDFLRRIADLKPAKVSSARFNEDAYAGLSMALQDIDWQQFGARYIVLITDAGAIPGDDALSSTRADAAQVRIAAQEKGVAIYVLHLKTPAGIKNHAQAQTQYEELSFNGVVNKPLYYPVDAGSVDGFGRMVDGLSQSIVQQAKLAYEGQLAIGSAPITTPNPSTEQEGSTGLATLKSDAALMGYAMQLAYLGQTQGVAAPSVFKAWVADRDLSNPARASTDVRVLLTKNQLSDLSTAVRSILDAANQSLIAPAVMFEQLRSVAATMGRDPNQLANNQQTTLAELGVLGEYLQDLPYRSDVLNLDEQTWSSWSAAQQQQFIRNLSSKLSLYQTFNADVDRWVSLTPGADAGDDVYPVPLEALP